MTGFKDMLKFFRMREGMTQKEFAKKIGISASAVSMYEMGKREPDFELEEKIADFFNTDLNTLRGIDSETNSYYASSETAAIAEDIRSNKELSMLFDAAGDARPEDLKQAHDLLLFLKQREQREN